MPEGKPRIGFLVTRKREAGFVRDMGGVVERLDRSRFEVVMLCPQGGALDLPAGDPQRAGPSG